MLNADDIHFYTGVFKGLDAEEIAAIIPYAGTRQLNAGEIYIRAGSESQAVAYIREGLIRAYHVKDNDEEVSVLLRWEGQFLASIDSIFFGRPSRFIYQALEATVLLELDYREALSIINTRPKLSTIRSTFLLHMLAQSMGRVESFILLSPEERYRQLLQEKPSLVNRVHDKHLATFLGITPVSLSRIRKRMASPRRSSNTGFSGL